MEDLYNSIRDKILNDKSSLCMPNELEMILFKEIQNEKGDKLPPDTIGVDYFFLRGFITRDMFIEFDFICQYFLDHCYDRLEDFAEVGSYYEISAKNYSVERSYVDRIMWLIYNGAKIKDEYCVALIKYLYKTYYKSEYKQLKRFSHISCSDVLTIANEDPDDFDFYEISRVLVMCSIMDIKIDHKASILYSFCANERAKIINDEEDDFNLYSDELFEKCREQVEEWCSDATVSENRLFKHYKRQERFISECFRHNNYPDNYLYNALDSYMGLKMEMVRTLCMLKHYHPNREYSFEEVQKYTALYSLVIAVRDTVEAYDWDIDKSLRIKRDDVQEYEKDEFIFDPDKIVVNKKSSDKKTEEKQIVNVAPVEAPKLSDEEYMSEISTLRNKLNAREQEISHLREETHKFKKNYEEADSLVQKYKDERSELIALRNYVYELTEGAPEEVTVELDEMKEFLAKQQIIIVGGYPAWINKLKSLFPDWRFISIDSYRTADIKMFSGANKVYFFTGSLSHAAYFKFITAVRDGNVPFGYIHSTNVDTSIKILYKDLLE